MKWSGGIMKDNRVLLLVVVISNISFIVLHTHKYYTIEGLLSTQATHQKELLALEQQEHTLRQELGDLHDRRTVMRYAQQYLDMAPVSVEQIYKQT